MQSNFEPPDVCSVPACVPGAPAAAPGFWGRELPAAPASIPWLWHSFLGGANVTLLTSQWKSGKTTLVSILLSRLKDGVPLAGHPILPLKPRDKRSVPGDPLGKALVLSEESRTLWHVRRQKLDLDHVYFICCPFTGKPTLDEWLALLDHVLRLHAAHAFDLFVIDTLTTFLPVHTETCVDFLMDALVPLRRLTQEGQSVLLVHHPKKGDLLPGQAARGTGALASFTDINLEMSWYTKADTTDRRRRLLAHSRYEDTPRQLVLELTADGTDYLVRDDVAPDEFTQNWHRLRLILEAAAGKKTRRELRTDWPAYFPCPSDATLYRWLHRAATAGLVCQEGTGRRADPFRYWLPVSLSSV